MAKKVKLEPEIKEQEMTMQEAQEKIKQMQTKGNLNKPSDEEILEVAKELDEANQSFQKKTYDIGTEEVADEIYNFILDFIENKVYWTKNGWMGVLRMHEELTKAKEEKKKGESFKVGYQALEFMFYILTNPGGIGLETAKAVEKVADFYANFIEMTGKVLESARNDLKTLQKLADKATAMKQGFYLEEEPGPEEVQKSEAFKAPSANDLLKK